jgi:hypothetical protein
LNVDVAVTPAVERIARVIAAHRLSANADGVDPSAAPEVDSDWREHRDEAVAILKVLCEPDADMAAAGDAATWKRMVAAALGERAPVATGGEPGHASRDPGTDPLYGGP